MLQVNSYYWSPQSFKNFMYSVFVEDTLVGTLGAMDKVYSMHL